MVATISQQRLQNLNCVLGLDCSKYQTDINWGLAKAAGIEFAFVKVTEGTTGHEDNLYNLKARVLSAQKNGVKVGYYHFARPGNVGVPEDDANEEAQNVLGHIAYLPKVEFPLAFDVEAYSSTVIWDNKVDHMNRFIKTFIEKLKEHNVDVLIYSYKSFLDTNSSPIFGTYPLWIAAYLNNPEGSLPVVPNGWTEWKIWQFTEKGQVNGYIGDIDLNIMHKDYFDTF
jgi:lysozyme